MIPVDPIPNAPTTEDQLARLSQLQARRISELCSANERLQRANEKLGDELVEANDARAQALVSLTHATQVGKALCHRLISERDTILKALTELVRHLRNQPITSLTYFGGEAFSQSVREAIELVTIIEGLQKAEDAKKRG